MSNTIRCIVVEDYEYLNNIYCNILDYEKDISIVGNAYNGDELFDLLKTTYTDVILLDIEMNTKIEGLVTCKKISEFFPDIKVIMLTCHEGDEMILKAFEVGAVDYVLKTSSMANIIEAVRSAYNGTSCLSSNVATVLRRRMKEYGTMKESLLATMNILSNLTSSELNVLDLLVKGEKSKDIARIRNVEMVTVKAHIGSILKKFDKKRTREVVKLIRDLELENYIN